MMNFKHIIAGALIAAASNVATADRIKDYASFSGVRQNQLVGYGLVVGLDGTGDQTAQTPFAVQSTLSMLQKLGVTLPPNAQLQLKNLATVIVTANMPAFGKIGQPIDVTVSSMGNAKSLRGGTLIATPLKGLDGQSYAVAQGSIIVSGAGTEVGLNRTTINHLTVGGVPAGATIERTIPTELGNNGTMLLELNSNTDFQMAGKVADSVNQVFPGKARALDGRSVELTVPADSYQRVTFLGQVENLPLGGPIHGARVIINARSGSVVLNQSVRVDECAVAHGNLMIQITTEPEVSQPGALSNGKTKVVERQTIQVKQAPGQFVRLPADTNLMQVVNAINNTGATPADLIAVLQAMRAAGALRAEIDVI
jgi:flagellar P-ring protein precursor FlgI